MPAAHKTRILVVDDDVCFAQVIKCALEKTGTYDVRCEDEAFRAVSTARAYQPDLILLDLVMPGLQGGDVASLLQDDAALTDVPLVILSATLPWRSTTTPERIIGGHAFLAKPVSLDVLIHCIEGRAGGARVQSAGSVGP